MEKFKLRSGVEPPDPGDLVGVSYGGAGIIMPSVFIRVKRGCGHYIVNHFILGGYWSRRTLPSPLTLKWLYKNCDYIYGIGISDRIIYADPRSLSEEQKEEYHVIKSIIQNEYKNNWATDSIK
tara:strand:+ start:66 stop:434 length:369 start_codon:yes stop_codon:yes gene_type:complete